jgi:hypothetical protein
MNPQQMFPEMMDAYGSPVSYNGYYSPQLSSQSSYGYWTPRSDCSASSNDSCVSLSPDAIRNPYYSYFMCAPSLYSDQTSPILQNGLDARIATCNYNPSLNSTPTCPVPIRPRKTKPVNKTENAEDHFGKCSMLMPLSCAANKPLHFKHRIRNTTAHQVVERLQTSNAHLVHNGTASPFAPNI